MPDEVIYKIGEFELIFPADHVLGAYQEKFRLYDRALGEIARIVAAKYPDATAVDIGANVGDSAAAICLHQNVPVLCVEGHPVFLSYLRRNIDRLPECVSVAECFVGAVAGSVSTGRIQTVDGTATLGSQDAGSAGNEYLPVWPLAKVLRDHPEFMHPRLLKSDTDGCDFEILRSSVDVLRNTMPVLYFEYDPTFRADGAEAGIRTIADLVSIGYQFFLVYDNFGHFMEIVRRDAVDRFADLSRLLMSHLFFGRQIYYLDICAFAPADEDLADQLREFHIRSVDECIRESGRRI